MPSPKPALVRILLAAALTSACGGGAPAGSNLAGSFGSQAPSSSGLIAFDGGSAYAANPDSESVSAFDPDTGRVHWETALGVAPTSIWVDHVAGSILVTLGEADRLVALDPETGEQVGQLATGRGPMGVVGDETSIYVSEEWDGAVGVYDRRTLQPLTKIEVGPRPHGLALHPGDSLLVVTHYLSGEVSTIDLDANRVERTISLGDEAVAAAHVTINEAGTRAFVPYQRSRVSLPSPWWSPTMVKPMLAMIGLEGDLEVTQVALDEVDRPVNLPTASALSPDQRRLFVTNAGSNDVTILDAASGAALGRAEVGHNPQGIAVAGGDVLVVNNLLGGDVSVIEASSGSETIRIPVTEIPLDAAVLEGKRLFNSANREAIARDRRISCASCHLGAATDGLSWQVPSGLRNTPSVRGLALTAPYHWDGGLDDLWDLAETVRRIQFGVGLTAAEEDSLAAFLISLDVQSSPWHLPDGTLSSRAERGREVFEASGCVDCHSGPAFTDRASHDVGTGGVFDTPSLLGLYATAPYLHDGRAESLEEVISSHPHPARHPVPAPTAVQLDDLVGYLISLP